MSHILSNPTSTDKGEEPWLAAKTYIWLMDLPGASAYGVFNGAMFRSLLALIKSWVESAAAGGTAVAGAGDTSSSSSSQQQQQPVAAASATGRSRRAAAVRSRTASQQQAEGEEEEEEEDDDDDMEDEGRGGRRGKARTSKRCVLEKDGTWDILY